MNLKKQEKITSREVSSSISQVAEKLGINAEQLKEGIANSFRESYCQGDNAEADLEFDFSGELTVFRKYRLVLEVKDVAKEIILDDSLLSQGKIVGEFFYLSLPVEGFSSNLIQDIGRRIRAGIREVRRQKQLENFRKQKDQLIKGRVSRVDSRLKVGIVDLEDGNIGYWPENEWQDPNRSSSSFFSRTIYFLINQVEESSAGSQIFLTRNSERFLQKIMELEIPEIKSGIIKIRHIIRIPRLLSKVIVESLSPSVDPVGTCVGFSAGRIISISKNTYPEERVDIIPWNEDEKQLLFSLLFPVKVISLLEKKEEWSVTVPDLYLTGGTGRNRIKLLKLVAEISKYLQKKIHLLPYDDSTESSQICVWNGNINYQEYQQLMINERSRLDNISKWDDSNDKWRR